MTANLERLAALYKQHRRIEEANVLDNLAKVFRRSGVPEVFPETAVKERGSEQVITLKKRLTEMLSTETVQPGSKVLTPELAEKIHRVGQQLDDTVPLNELTLKIKGSYGEFSLPAQVSAQEEGAYQIDDKIVRPFNMLLHKLIKGGFETVGSVRESTLTEIVKKVSEQHYMGISVDSARFIRSSLAKPSTQ